MITETLKRFSTETRSFNALIIMNITGAGLAVSMGVARGIKNILPMVNAQKILIPEALTVGLVLAWCVLGLRWLIAGAEMLDEFQDIVEGQRRMEKEPDPLTGLIVQNMAFYRDHRPTIGMLAWGSTATGAFFLLSALIQVRYIVSLLGASSSWEMLFSLVGFGLCLALGIIGVYLPSVFRRYTATWDRRLQESSEAEKRLGELLEGSS